MKKKEQSEYPEESSKKKKKKKEEKKHAGKKGDGKGSLGKKTLKKGEQEKKPAAKKDLKKGDLDKKTLKEKSAEKKQTGKTEEKLLPQEQILQKQIKVEEMVPEQIFHALGDHTRLKILQILAQEELCAADLLGRLSIVQSTLSHHMKILCEAKLVLCRKQGKWTYYCLHPEGFEQAGHWLRTFSGKEMS